LNPQKVKVAKAGTEKNPMKEIRIAKLVLNWYALEMKQEHI
jgi:hypothetical protein